MVPVGSSSFAVSNRAPGPGVAYQTEPTFVWLAGEHDISTDDALRRTLGRAVALGGTALVLDMSDVQFMSAATLRTIFQAREFLRRRSGTLTVRAPSAFVRRIISICGSNDLLGPDSEQADGPTGKALSSWVAVPAAERSGGRLRRSEIAPSRHLVSVCRATAPRTRAGGANGPEEIA